MKEADSEGNPLRKALTVSRCLYCRRVLKRSERRRGYDREFCSTDHRIKFWTLRRALEDYREGRANGLKEMIEELKR